MNTAIQELAQNIRCDLFVTPESIASAFDQAYKLAQASDNPAAVMTAVQCVVNAISNELLKIKDED